MSQSSLILTVSFSFLYLVGFLLHMSCILTACHSEREIRQISGLTRESQVQTTVNVHLLRDLAKQNNLTDIPWLPSPILGVPTVCHRRNAISYPQLDLVALIFKLQKTTLRTLSVLPINVVA